MIETASSKTVPTALPGLDSVLLGGLRAPSVALVEGLPGTGKTILASEFAARNAGEARQCTLYIGFEMNELSFHMNFDSFRWPKTDRLKFLETDVTQFVEDLMSPSPLLEKRIRDERITRLVIDSLTPISMYFSDKGDRAYRDFLGGLFKRLRSLGVLALVITETQPSRSLGETGAGPEHFLADTVITLRKAEQRRGIMRSLEVAKSRGQQVILGRHSFCINDGAGVEVYPRAYARHRLKVEAPVSADRLPFGIPGLEEMVGGGLLKGSSTLISGISGTGKTIAAMHFLNEGLKRGENVLLVSIDDSPAQFCRNASQVGFKFEPHVASGQLTILHDSPLEIELDRHFCRIENVIREKECTRVVVDSLATYELMLPVECHEFLLALVGLFKAYSATSLFAYECSELLGISQITQNVKASALADNIVLLNYVEISTMLRRAITVPKTRGSLPNQETREYVIRHGGIALLDEATVPVAEKVPQLPLSCYYGVLARSPTRHSPIIDESVAAGKPMPKSKIPKPVKRTKPVAEPPPDELN